MISPRLAITSPTRGCGKTTALDVISHLVLRPLSAANVSASAIFRVAEGFRPTLLIDEADTFLKDNEELRGVLNSGHRKGGAVLRTVGDDHEPRSFSTYGACAIALIGQLPGTLTDRSVPITLVRRKRDEDITPFRLDRVAHLVVLARKLARWTADHEVAIAATEPEMPAGIYNRAADNWRPLLSIATVAGGDWVARGQRAALAGVAADIDDAALLELLLGDIRTIFASREVERMPSAALVEALAEMHGRPWAEYSKNDKPITQNKLAGLLKPLKIVPENIRIDDKVLKGYLSERFEEAFSRYLDPEGSSEPLHRYNLDKTSTSEHFQTATAEADVADRKCVKPYNGRPCSGVADEKGDQGGDGEVCAHSTRPGGLEFHLSDGSSARLHRECEAPYRSVVDEGHGDDRP
jgi:putative DNA primase/helicase